MSITHGLPAAKTKTPPPSGVPAWGNEVLSLLDLGFDGKFHLLDGQTGEAVWLCPQQPAADWDRWSAMIGEVARRGQPEFIEEQDPLLVLAVPLPRPDNSACVAVAVGVFLGRALRPDEDLTGAARTLGLDPEQTAQWARSQLAWTPDSLLRIGHMAIAHWSGRQQLRRLEEETHKLSNHLAATYEEISLLHRLTQNLKISESDEDLGRVALEWLVGVLPAEGLAILFLPVAHEDESLAHQARTAPVLVTAGRCPLGEADLARVIEYCEAGAGGQPLVVNPPVSRQADWPLPGVRQLIAVPLVESNNLFGWLVAVNHVDDQEFGTVEASLLSSVGAILGIHSGNIELYRQQSELLAGVVRALTSDIDAKDPYTRGHSDRVARISVRLAQELGYSGDALNTIYLSGLLHDIGKIGINDSVLRKPGKLSHEEYEHIKRHVEIGHRILVDLKKLDEVLPVVLHHHESWDGQGYPNRLTSETIPQPARIVAVADAYDAMGSDRPYRAGLPDEKIDEVFRMGAGKQWDPEVIGAFFRVRSDLREIVRRSQAEAVIQMPVLERRPGSDSGTAQASV